MRSRRAGSLTIHTDGDARRACCMLWRGYCTFEAADSKLRKKLIQMVSRMYIKEVKPTQIKIEVD